MYVFVRSVLRDEKNHNIYLCAQNYVTKIIVRIML